MSTSLLRHLLHSASPHVSYSFLRRHSLFPCHAVKRGSVKPRGNNLLEEFYPAGKKVKSRPPGFVFIPVINQIAKESWKTFKGKRRQTTALLYPPCDSQQGFCCASLCPECSVGCYILFLRIASTQGFFLQKLTAGKGYLTAVLEMGGALWKQGEWTLIPLMLIPLWSLYEEN